MKLSAISGQILDVFLTTFLVVTSADILYLYYAGGWVEPNRFIPMSELVLLYCFVVVGAVRTVFKVRKLRR